MRSIVELCAKVCEENKLDARLIAAKNRVVGGKKTELKYQHMAEAHEMDARAIRALPDAEISAIMPKAGGAVANWPHDWPIEHTHQHVCSTCHTSYRGWEKSDKCYACFTIAAPAALPEKEEATLVSYAPDGSSCELGINGVSFYYENGKACACEDCKRNAALLAAAQGVDK